MVQAAVTATGDFSPDPLVDGESVDIGQNGYGTLLVDDGSTFNSLSVRLGGGTIGFGTATVTGAGSLWSFQSGDVGQTGLGRLEVRQGGVVDVAFGGLELGNNSPGHGTVIVSDPGSLLLVEGPLSIGQAGAGVLEIANDAIVNAPTGTPRVGDNGRIEFDGGFLRANDFENRGLVTGSGELSIQCCGQAENLGRMEAGQGDHLLVTSIQGNGLTNRGELIAEGGELEIHHLLTNETSGPTQGQITLRDGTLRVGVIGGGNQFPAQLRNRGLLVAIGGENHVYGTVGNEFNSQIAVTNNSLVMFHHDVESDYNTTISVFAGSTAIFLQDLVLNSGTLLADLAGAEGFGHVEVVGHAELNGSLAISLSADYAPQAGDAFPLVTAANGIGGQFQLADDVPPLPGGLAWELAVGANRVVLNVVVPTVDGDYNGNGIVDAADFTVWRDMLGQVGDGLAADGTGPTGTPDGVVDQLDYQFWKDRFGNTLDGSAGSAAASPALAGVPEPSAWALAMLAMAAAVGRRAMSRR